MLIKHRLIKIIMFNMVYLKRIIINSRKFVW